MVSVMDFAVLNGFDAFERGLSDRGEFSQDNPEGSVQMPEEGWIIVGTFWCICHALGSNGSGATHTIFVIFCWVVRGLVNSLFTATSPRAANVFDKVGSIA